MIYRLMIKTHIKTGVNYLCVTNRKNWKSYKGSGKRWWKLLNKIPSEIDTWLLYESENINDFNFACRLYSEKLNVVDSWVFANLIPEIGYDKNSFSRLGAERLKESGNRSGICSKNWRKQNPEKTLQICSVGGKVGGLITGKMYWWNNGTINTKSYNCPGPDWTRGMLMSEKKKAQVYRQIAGHNRKQR